MAVSEHSRYLFTRILQDDRGRLHLGTRTPFRYRYMEDMLIHECASTDTLHNIAARYYQAYPWPEMLYWVIADFQPDPIIDPTLALEPGRVLFIPSAAAVGAVILSEERRTEDGD